jgi:hypothetical protein
MVLGSGVGGWKLGFREKLTSSGVMMYFDKENNERQDNNRKINRRTKNARVKAVLRRAFARIGCAISLVGIGGLAEPHEIGIVSELPESQSGENAE